MFFPLGLGGIPSKIPVGILLLTLICFAWSVQFFPTVVTVNKIIEEKTNLQEYQSLVTSIKVHSCIKKFAMPQICDETLGKSFGRKKNNSISILKDLQKRKIASDSEQTTETNLIAQKTNQLKHSPQLITDILNYGNEFQIGQKWPIEAQSHPDYNKAQQIKNFVSSTFAKYGFFSLANRGIFSFLRATFVHGNWLHLFGNVILLILIGIWVEQCLGIALTLLIFIGGSFLGLYLELFMTQPPSVLGASGGVMALIGAYFVLFFKTETQLLFVIFPVYFKKISIPSLWFFPFFYLLTDFIGVNLNSASGVAHWGHIGGLIFGMASCYYFRKQLPVSGDELFPEEKNIVNSLKKERDPQKIWELAKSIVRLNPQNWQAVDIFLHKIREEKIELNDKKCRSWLENVISFNLQHILKRSSVSEMIHWLEAIPESLEMNFFLKNVPLAQILFLADHSANKSNLILAKKLFLTALNKNPSQDQSQRIHSSIKIINQELENAS